MAGNTPIPGAMPCAMATLKAKGSGRYVSGTTKLSSGSTTCVGLFYARPARGSCSCCAAYGQKWVAPLLQFLALSIANGAEAPAPLRCLCPGRGPLLRNSRPFEAFRHATGMTNSLSRTGFSPPARGEISGGGAGAAPHCPAGHLSP